MKDRQKVIESFLRAKARDYAKPSTLSRHQYNLKYFFKYNGRREIYLRNVEGFVDHYMKGHRPATVRSLVNTMKCFTRYLLERKIITQEIHTRLRNVKDQPFAPKLISPTQVRMIIDCPREWGKYHKWVDGRRYDLFFELLAGCGLRCSEALNLKVCDFDLSNNEFTLIGKGSEVRTIPIPKVVKGNLISWIQDKKLRPNDYVFAKERGGRRPSRATFTDELKKRLEILGYDKTIHLHTFRHVFITEAYRAGLNPIKIMKIVGHNSIKTHLRYMHLIGNDLHNEVDEHPINKLPEAKQLPDKPKLPQFFVEDDLRVN